MDLHALRLFLHLANSLHFGRTSRACHVSPSTLSRAILRLEAECGAPLFLRDRRTVALTEAGENFRGFAAGSLRDWEILRETLEGRARELQGELSVFCSVTAAWQLLPRLLAEFRRRHPGVKVSIATGDANTAPNRVTAGEADLAIGPFPGKISARLRARPIARTPLRLIIPVIEGEVRKSLSTAKIDWSRVPVILPDVGIIREHLLAWFRHKRVTPRVINQVAGHEAILALVSLGLGVGVVPQLVLEGSLPYARVEVLDVRPRFPVYTVGLYALQAHRQRPVIEAFWATAESIFS